MEGDRSSVGTAFSTWAEGVAGVSTVLTFLTYFHLGLLPGGVRVHTYVAPVRLGPVDCGRVSVGCTARVCWVVVGSVVGSSHRVMPGVSV